MATKVCRVPAATDGCAWAGDAKMSVRCYGNKMRLQVLLVTHTSAAEIERRRARVLRLPVSDGKVNQSDAANDRKLSRPSEVFITCRPVPRHITTELARPILRVPCVWKYFTKFVLSATRILELQTGTGQTDGRTECNGHRRSYFFPAIGSTTLGHSGSCTARLGTHLRHGRAYAYNPLKPNPSKIITLSHPGLTYICNF